MSDSPITISEDFGNAGSSPLQDLKGVLPDIGAAFSQAASGVMDFMKEHPGVAKWASFGIAFMAFLGPGQDLLKRIPGVGEIYNKFSSMPLIGAVGSLGLAFLVGNYASNMATRHVSDQRQRDVARRNYATNQAVAPPPAATPAPPSTPGNS